MKHVLSMLIAHVQQNRWIPVIPQGRRVLSKKTLQPILMEKPWSQPVEHMMGTYSISMHLYEFIAYLCKFDNIYIYIALGIVDIDRVTLFFVQHTYFIMQ